jgi:hypothetical protein
MNVPLASRHVVGQPQSAFAIATMAASEDNVRRSGGRSREIAQLHDRRAGVDMDIDGNPSSLTASCKVKDSAL